MKIEVPKLEIDGKMISKNRYVELNLRKTITRNEKWMINSKPFDPFLLQVNLRSRSKLDAHCVICLKDHDIEMHHIKHVRKATTSKGFDKLMGIINRKQLPVCKECHKKDTCRNL